MKVTILGCGASWGVPSIGPDWGRCDPADPRNRRRRVSALVEIGEYPRARDLCERLLAHSSELYLYAEELDPKTGRHLGNFPQAFTHLALINAVVHVIRAEGAQDPTAFAPVRLTA